MFCGEILCFFTLSVCVRLCDGQAGGQDSLGWKVKVRYAQRVRCVKNINSDVAGGFLTWGSLISIYERAKPQSSNEAACKSS